jgi:hypothetical protein
MTSKASATLSDNCSPSVCREDSMLELLERQTKLTKNQWKIIATPNLGDMLDFFDFFLIGYALAIIPKDWHLTYGQSTVSCCPPASAPSPAPFSGAGWPIASAAARCSSPPRSTSRSPPALQGNGEDAPN